MDRKKMKRLTILIGSIALCFVLMVSGLLFSKLVKKDNSEAEDVGISDPRGIYFAAASEVTNATIDSEFYKGGSIFLDGIGDEDGDGEGDGAVFEMDGGTISGHSARYGGAIYVANGATFIMNGGTIEDCVAMYGGAIYVESGGKCIINGGTITSNRSNYAPAIFVERGGYLKISADAYVDLNTITSFVSVEFDLDGDSTTTNTLMILEETDLNNKELYPEIPTNSDGYAGEWILETTTVSTFTASATSSLSSNNYKFVVNYGDGTEDDPYLIEDHIQFKKFVDYYGAELTTTFYDGSGNVVEESSALKKVVSYRTVDEIWTRTSTSKSWVRDSYDASNKKYFRLIEDIDLSRVNINLGLSASFSLDGTKYDIFRNNTGSRYSLKNLDGARITDGSMFYDVYDTSLTNLNIKVINSIGNIISACRGGFNLFKNITIDAVNDETIMVSQDGSNTAVLLNFVLNNAMDVNCSFENVINNVDYMSYCNYFGLFIGGYGRYDTATINFKNCINTGNVTCAGTVGMFYGNSAHRPGSTTIENCANYGDFTYKGATSHPSWPHIFAPHINMVNDAYTEDELAAYDETIDGVMINEGQFIKMESVLQATYNADAVTISTKDGSALPAGSYTIEISAYMWTERLGVTSEYMGSLRAPFYFTIEIDEENTESSITVENIRYHFYDRIQFEEAGGTYVDEEWKEFTYDKYKYKMGTLSGKTYYVIDTKGEFYSRGEAQLGTPKVVAIAKDGKVIDFTSASYAS